MKVDGEARKVGALGCWRGRHNADAGVLAKSVGLDAGVLAESVGLDAGVLAESVGLDAGRAQSPLLAAERYVMAGRTSRLWF